MLLACNCTPLNLELTRFEVTETEQFVGSTYVAAVGIRASLGGQDGTQLWNGNAFGEARRYGEDESAANCNEVLSDAIKDSLVRLLSQPELQARWAPAIPGAATSDASAAPAQILEALLRLKAGGMSDDTIIAFAKKQKLSSPLTTADILQWKEMGIPEAAIQAVVGAGE